MVILVSWGRVRVTISWSSDSPWNTVFGVSSRRSISLSPIEHLRFQEKWHLNQFESGKADLWGSSQARVKLSPLDNNADSIVAEIDRGDKLFFPIPLKLSCIKQPWRTGLNRRQEANGNICRSEKFDAYQITRECGKNLEDACQLDLFLWHIVQTLASTSLTLLHARSQHSLTSNVNCSSHACHRDICSRRL